MARTVEIALSDEFLLKTQENDVQTRTVSEAVGYLSTWALNGMGNYAGKLSIYGDKNGDLHATYRNKEGSVTYNIFGQLNEKEYSFHS